MEPIGAAARTASCFFCGAPGLPGGTCATCLVRLPDPSAPDVAVRPECPRCKGQLLAIGFGSEAVMHACAACRGLFLPARAWCALVDRPDLVASIEQRLPGGSAPPSALVSLVKCASCGAQMERGRFAATSDVVVDVCVAHGMWLDPGELGPAVRYAAHRKSVGVEATVREAAARGNRSPRLGAAPAILDAIAEERARAIAANRPRASVWTWVKRVSLGLGVLLLVLRVVLYFTATRGAGPIQGQGDQTRRAAEGAGSELAP